MPEGPRTRARLQIDPFAPRAIASTPSESPASTTRSPLTTRPHSRSSETTEEDEDKACAPGLKGDSDKPKRCRVTPEQLVHLERFFSAERSPTASRRREISELLGMQERQTQIWFQNRRAKAKLQNSKIKKTKDSSPDAQMIPRLSMTFENELNNLIHEDEPVTFIPCSNLSIGCWRRITTDTNQRDLVAYTCENKRCLTWFIHNSGFGFKMEIPFDTILHAEFTSMSPGPTGLASFALSRPPLFYLESTSEDGIPRRWKRSTDWTEGHQASQVLRHDLLGNAASLAFLVQSLQANAEVASPYSPYYRSQPPSPMEIPPPPLSVIQRTEQQPYPEESTLLRPTSHHRSRSAATSNDLSHLIVTGLPHYGRDLPHTAPPVSYTHTSYLPGPAPIRGGPILVPEEPSLEDHRSQSVTHDMTPRSFLAQPVPRQFYEKATPASFLFNPSEDSLFSQLDSNALQMYHATDLEIGLHSI